MSAKRAETSTVNITLRVKESLREHLEFTAKAHRVSLNAEIIDRLEYGRDRMLLLPEVLRMAYGDRVAGLLMVLGRTMSVAGALPRRGIDSVDQVTDAHVYEQMEKAAAAVLAALRPTAPPPTA